MARDSLKRFAWLSIAAAIVTISLKTVAWWLTGSVGLLSDAMESVVNLVAAVVALWMLTLAARPPDEEHAYGYSKAEYFASAFEGALIFVAALAIGWAAVDRLLDPQPLERVGAGVVVSLVASAVNFAVAQVLFRAGRRHQSIALEADARHLMTDVWTSAGVIIGILAVGVTGWYRLDPIIALAVAANIVVSGFQLMRRSALGLLDRALPEPDRKAIAAVLARYEDRGLEFHALRTRQAAGRSFISLHVLVPGDWSVRRGHLLVEEIEDELRKAVPRASILAHLEPLGEPASYRDQHLDR
ncbi:MAG: cation diffusion facilitator family transporter [Burkholderiales bacterium]|jgi:cation diffusion facilitator family transporter|nr:cation diffusion facilitator family transporter [Burkholderiales bacterium]